MREQEKELEFSEPYSHIPDGVYEAKCIDYSKPIPFRGTRKIFLTFEILTEPYQGTKIFMPFSVGFGPIAQGSKYYKYWTIANGNMTPSRNAKASARMFINKFYKIITRTVKPRIGPTVKLVNDSNITGTELNLESWYSVVDYFELSCPYQC